MGELCYRGGDTQYVQLVHQQLKSHACSIQKKSQFAWRVSGKTEQASGLLVQIFRKLSKQTVFPEHCAHNCLTVTASMHLESVEDVVAVAEVTKDVEHGVLGDVAGTRDRLHGAGHFLTVDERRHAVSPGVAWKRFHHLE